MLSRLQASHKVRSGPRRCCTLRWTLQSRCPASQAANLTEEQFTELWQGYIDTAATCLLQANNDPESPAGQTLVRKLHAYSSQ